ncbi:MAG: alpha/beta hydrolase [Rhodobacter sp.]|nr:alpha/beta hydrolase [Rhodobacter sp.]
MTGHRAAPPYFCRMRNALVVSLLFAALSLAACGPALDDRERAAEAAYPPQGQFVEVAGRRVHAVVTGQGPDLVLIHGASGNVRDFTFGFVDRVKSRYRVIVFDRPGLGYSDPIPGGDSPRAQARALRAAASQLGVTNPIVLGQSYGAAVALAWGLEAPDATAGLVTVSGTTLPWPKELTSQSAVIGTARTRATLAPLIAALADEADATGPLRLVFSPQRPPAGYADFVGVGLALRRDTIRNNARQIAALRDSLMEMSRDYRDLRLPVEIVHGTADRIVSPEIHATPLTRRLPNARLRLIPRGGHMPHHTHPGEVIAAIDRVARRVSQR